MPSTTVSSPIRSSFAIAGMSAGHSTRPRWQKPRRVLLGRHDFHSFETDWPNRTSSIRTIFDLHVERSGSIVTIEVEADGFLYNMVRSIAGTLGVGRLPANAPRSGWRTCSRPRIASKRDQPRRARIVLANSPL